MRYPSGQAFSLFNDARAPSFVLGKIRVAQF